MDSLGLAPSWLGSYGEGRWEEVSIKSQVLPTYDTEMGIYSWKVYDLRRKMKGFINSDVKIIIARKLG